jgi:hypothetical protein
MEAPRFSLYAAMDFIARPTMAAKTIWNMLGALWSTSIVQDLLAVECSSNHSLNNNARQSRMVSATALNEINFHDRGSQ